MAVLLAGVSLSGFSLYLYTYLHTRISLSVKIESNHIYPLSTCGPSNLSCPEPLLDVNDHNDLLVVSLTSEKSDSVGCWSLIPIKAKSVYTTSDNDKFGLSTENLIWP